MGDPFRMSESFVPGTETQYASDSATSSFSALFEDDGETAHFYAYDRNASEAPILDAVHIYNVANVVDRSAASIVDIRWSADGLKAALLLNDQPHAVIDFGERCSYCRTGFPTAQSGWRRGIWHEELMKLFQDPSPA
jgi:hypothetical protein